MFTANQLQILAILINHPEKTFYLSELGRILEKAPGVFHRGINSLENQGIISGSKQGNQKLFRINKTCLFYNGIKELTLKTYGAKMLLKKAVENISEISLSLIYGSYAKNTMRADSDIDLLAVGACAAEEALLDEICRIEKKIQREINYRFYSDNEFAREKTGKNPFLQRILSEKHILLKGHL